MNPINQSILQANQTCKYKLISISLLGLLYRNKFFLENGIKPIWVFDGKAPSEKYRTLDVRLENKKKSNDQYKECLKKGDIKTAVKYAKRTIQVTKEMNDDAKTLTKLMGLPLIEVNLI